jgi:hypothetical protein
MLEPASLPGKEVLAVLVACTRNAWFRDRPTCLRESYRTEHVVVLSHLQEIGCLHQLVQEYKYVFLLLQNAVNYTMWSALKLVAVV